MRIDKFVAFDRRGVRRFKQERRLYINRYLKRKRARRFLKSLILRKEGTSLFSVFVGKYYHTCCDTAAIDEKILEKTAQYIRHGEKYFQYHGKFLGNFHVFTIRAEIVHTLGLDCTVYNEESFLTFVTNLNYEPPQ